MKGQAAAASEPIAVLGDTRRKALRASVLTDLNAWLKQWSTVPGSSLSAEVGKVTDASVVSATATARIVAYGQVDGDVHLYALASDEGATQLLGVHETAGVPHHESGSAARDATQELLRSLAHTVMTSTARPFEAMVASAERVADIRAEAKRYSRWWKITVDCAAHRSVLVLMLSPQLLAWLAPMPASASAGDVAKRSAAIVDNAVRVKVMLGEVEMTVGELAALGVDDVIVLDESLSHLASVLSTEDVKISNASLGRVGSQRAVRLRG